MFPLRDHNPSGIFPIVSSAFIFFNVIIFLYSLSFSEAHLEAFYNQYAIIPAEIFWGNNWTTLFSAMFLHGGWMHLFGNMLFLFIFGDNLESRLGKIRFLLFYVMCGICASVAQIAIDPLSTVPNIGASGAIAGVLGAYLVLYPKAQVNILMIIGGFTRISTLPALYMLLYWFVVQIISGVSTIGMEGGGVAYFAHIGGFVAGGITGFFLRKQQKNIVISSEKNYS